jgi:hypothetical protein
MSKVAWDYIVPVKLPADLKGIEPGKLPAHLLRPIEAGGKMHWLAAAAYNAMDEAAKAEGIELKPTSAGDTYRSYESQLAGFKQRYQLEPVVGTSTKTFEGKTWYLKKGMAMLATPGKSQHNLGLAVDIANASEPKRLNWMIANVKKFGFSWEVVPSEPWHLRYVDGDTPPAAVAEWMSKNNWSKPAGAATAQAAPAASGGANIKKLQEALKAKGFYKGEINGQKDAATDAAIKAFKVANKLPADSVPGPKVMELLGIKA